MEPLEERRASNNRRKRGQDLDIAVSTGRLLGMLVVGLALAVGIKSAIDVRTDQYWSFLATWIFLTSILTPMAIGFLILVASEILNRLGRLQE